MTYDPGALWDQRAQQYGRRAVLDLGLSPGEAEALTELQEEILMHRLDQAIEYRDLCNGLDFGCGVGRFTRQLALRCDRLVCYDPSPKLVDLGRADNADLKGDIWWASGQPQQFIIDCTINPRFDFIFISLVLGGIPDSELPALASGLGGLVHLGGVILFAEHVSEHDNGSAFWHFRPTATYLGLFQGFKTRLVDSYLTRGNMVSVFEARKC